MSDPAAIEGLLRGIATGALAAIAGALALTRTPSRARWFGIAFIASAIGHVLDNWDLLRPSGVHANLATQVLSELGPGLFWAFAVSLFDDDRRPVWTLIAIPSGSLGLALLSSAAPPATARLAALAYAVLSAALVVHVLVVAIAGWRGDLVEPRRRLRPVIVVAAATYVLVMALGEIGQALRLGGLASPMPQAVALAVLSLAGAALLLRADGALLSAAPPQLTASTRQVIDAMSAADRRAAARLSQAMDEEVWRQETLSIGVLAARLGLPEHRLRRLINRDLGHRNFAAFVNARRVEAAKAVLADAAVVDKPISSIAYDLGFGSLGPFNRAFKAATGVTPTAWRQGARGVASPDSA